MIFVTVGAQMPFDRLVRWMDDWAAENGRTDLTAQIGDSELTPRALSVLPFMDPVRFRRHMQAAHAVVAHAGMGTILTALELGKPILVVPRLGARSETRNDHQVATAQRFAADGLVLAAYEQSELDLRMQQLEQRTGPARIGSRASDTLLARLRQFALDEHWPPDASCAAGAEP